MVKAGSWCIHAPAHMKGIEHRGTMLESQKWHKSHQLTFSMWSHITGDWVCPGKVSLQLGDPMSSYHSVKKGKNAF